jgi:hypothetical protein
VFTWISCIWHLLAYFSYVSPVSTEVLKLKMRRKSSCLLPHFSGDCLGGLPLRAKLHHTNSKNAPSCSGMRIHFLSNEKGIPLIGSLLAPCSALTEVFALAIGTPALFVGSWLAVQRQIKLAKHRYWHPAARCLTTSALAWRT